MKTTTMKPFLPLKLALGLLPGLLLISCSKENVEPSSQIDFKFRNINHNEAQSGGSTETTKSVLSTEVSINWTSGFAEVKDIVVATEDKSGKREFHSASTKINLFAPLSGMGSVYLPSGNYTQVKFKLDLQSVQGDPALELQGSYKGIPLILRIEEPLVLETNKDSMTVSAINNYTSIASLDPAVLTKGVTDDLMFKAKITEDQIIISASTNRELYDMILQNIHNSVEGEFKVN